MIKITISMEFQPSAMAGIREALMAILRSASTYTIKEEYNTEEFK